MLIDVYLFAVVFAAFVVKGVTGFGNTLVISPMFSLAVPNRVTTPVDLIFSIPTNLFIAWKERAGLSLKTVLPLSLMMIIGILPGAYLLKIGNEWVLRTFCGLTTVVLAIDLYLRGRQTTQQKPTSKALLWTIGIFSGLLSGLFGIGAFLVSYINRTADNPKSFRADLCCVFLAENLFRLFLYWQTDIFNSEAMRLSLLLSPAMAIGMVAGLLLRKHLKARTVTQAMVWLLVISGSLLTFRSVFFH